MTRPNLKPKSSKPKKIPPVNSKSTDTSQAEALDHVEIFLNHRRAIDTLDSLLNLMPDDDHCYGVLALISKELNRTFLDAIPVFASSSAKSWGPTSTNDQRAR